MRLSKNFVLDEFRCGGCKNGRCNSCQSCKGVVVNNLLVNKLQELRNRFGTNIMVNSGYRCPTFNKKVGGHPQSYHLTGRAADIRPRNPKDLKKLYGLALVVFKDYGVGKYPTFVHVDVGKKRVFKG